jgi:hypothetical protein
VIIKGTQIYDAESGGWKELSMLDIGQVRRTTDGGAKRVDGYS